MSDSWVFYFYLVLALRVPFLRFACDSRTVYGPYSQQQVMSPAKPACVVSPRCSAFGVFKVFNLNMPPKARLRLSMRRGLLTDKFLAEWPPTLSDTRPPCAWSH